MPNEDYCVYSCGRGGRDGVLCLMWVGMCHQGFQIWSPFLKRISIQNDTLLFRFSKYLAFWLAYTSRYHNIASTQISNLIASHDNPTTGFMIL